MQQRPMLMEILIEFGDVYKKELLYQQLVYI